MRQRISEQILRILANGNTTRDFRWDIREINLLVNQFRDAFIRRDYLNDRQFAILEEASSSMDEQILSTFEDVEVLYNENRDLHYSLLDAEPMSKGSNAMLSISLMQSQYSPFIPISPTSLGVLYGTEAYDLGGHTGFWREKNKIYYHNLKCPTPKHVLITMVGSSSTLSNEKFSVPPHLEIEIIQGVVSLLGSRMQDNQDYKNDNMSK